MRSRLTATASAAITIVMLTIGCGSGEESPDRPVQESDFIRQVDHLCGVDRKRTDQAGPKFDAAVRKGRLDVAANLVLKLQRAESKTIRQIEAIVPPEVYADEIAEYIRLTQLLNELDTKIAGAVRVENLTVFRDTLKEGESLDFKRKELAGRIGLGVCGPAEEDVP